MLFKRSLLVVLAIVTVAMVSLVYAPPGGPPSIGTPVIQPDPPGPGDAVTIMVDVADNQGVDNVTIVYTTDNWQSVNSSIMAAYNSTSHVATAQMPGLPFGGNVTFYIVAFDGAGNRGVNDNNGAYFTYYAPAASPVSVTTLAFVGVLAAVGAGAGLMAYMMLKHRPASASPKTPSRQDQGQY